MMIGMNDAVDFFAEVAMIIDDNDIEVDKIFSERYTCAMNRLRYERDKSVGVKKKQVKKVHGAGCLEYCGNCGFELTIYPQYRFCPNCGYRIKE